MTASLQSRVLALVGAGVFIAVGALTLLSRSTLLSLEREVRYDHERLAASLARELIRAIGDDLRLVSGTTGVGTTDLPAALRSVRSFGRLTSAAFVADGNGILLACEPVYECGALRRDLVMDATRQSRERTRPYIADPVANADGLRRLVAVIPLRRIPDRPAVVAGVVIDPSDRRLVDLLNATELAPTLQTVLRDSRGGTIIGHDPAASPGYLATAPVSGTGWRLELRDVGPDPVAPIVAFRSRSLWLIPAFAAVAMLLGWGIARSVRGPLVDLTSAAERIARGELAEPIDTERAAAGGDEVARLAIALERMRADLQSSILTIERANQDLEAKIIERTRELADVNQALEQREQLRQTLLRRVISAQEDERKRIARELHDETSQALAALAIGVDVARAACGPSVPAEVTRRLDELRSLADRMHNELHRTIVNLRPSVLDDLGLPAAIRWFVEHSIAPAGLAVRCEFSGLDERLAPEVETATFRVVQEALNNVVRHARAETVLLQASLADGTLVVEIEDDGAGFDEADVIRVPGSMRGIGLLGIRERIEILGGETMVDSKPGSGTRIVFRIPVTSGLAERVSAES